MHLHIFQPLVWRQPATQKFSQVPTINVNNTYFFLISHQAVSFNTLAISHHALSFNTLAISHQGQMMALVITECIVQLPSVYETCQQNALVAMVWVYGHITQGCWGILQMKHKLSLCLKRNLPCDSILQNMNKIFSLYCASYSFMIFLIHSSCCILQFKLQHL